MSTKMLTQAEIARMVGVSRAAVRGRVKRGQLVPLPEDSRYFNVEEPRNAATIEAMRQGTRQSAEPAERPGDELYQFSIARNGRNVPVLTMAYTGTDDDPEFVKQHAPGELVQDPNGWRWRSPDGVETLVAVTIERTADAARRLKEVQRMK